MESSVGFPISPARPPPSPSTHLLRRTPQESADWIHSLVGDSPFLTGVLSSGLAGLVASAAFSVVWRLSVVVLGLAAGGGVDVVLVARVGGDEGGSVWFTRRLMVPIWV